MAYDKDVSLLALKEMLTYDPENGEIRWLRSPARNIYPGELAGCVKALRKNKNGEDVKYRYIRLNGANIPAQRIAYALHNGEFPEGRISFVDGDTLNLRADNLQMQRFISSNEDRRERDRQYYRKHREVHGLSYAENDLKRKYGIGLAEYSQMFMAQNGKCAICHSDYGGHRNGEQKALAVDHDHQTGKVRGLLCEPCNQGLGKFKDDATVVLAAYNYLTNATGASSPEAPVFDLGPPALRTDLADSAQTSGRNLVQEV